MSNFIFKSNSAILATSPSPAWTTTQQSGYFMPLVQGSEISISVDRQTSKQIGSQQYAIDDIVRSPDVNFNVDYLFSPSLPNEYLFGIYQKNKVTAPNDLKIISPTDLNIDQNFYLIINDQAGDDFLPSFTGETLRSNFSGVTCVSIGNCFLNNYSMSFSIGSIPTVSCAFVGSNLQFVNLTGNTMGIPAINLESGNQVNSGFVDFSNFNVSLSKYSSGLEINELLLSDSDIYRMPVIGPGDVQLQLTNLQCGGSVLIGDALIQSMNIDIPFERTNLYGLGSNYVYNRKTQCPARGSVSFSAIVKNFNSGSLSSINQSESDYDFNISFFNVRNAADTEMKIENAKINSCSHSMSVNGDMRFDASYSFALTDLSGFKMLAKEEIIWRTLGAIWSGISNNWNLT